MSGFVHLRVHTEYSLVDSVLRVGPLVAAVERLSMPAVAVTDLGNVSAIVKFYRAAADRGIKPIIGTDVLTADSREEREPGRLTLLVADAEGFKSISRLLTQAYTEGGGQEKALLLKEWLTLESCRGLIALSGAQYGELGRVLGGSRPERAAEVLDYWRTRFPERFYIELQRVGRPGEQEYLEAVVALAAEHAVPVVATNEVCFLSPDEFEAHETRVCIAQGRILDEPGRPRNHTEQQYLKSAAEMAELFSDLPEALANTVEVAKRCTYELRVGEIFLPDFPLPEGMTAQDHLREQSRRGLEQRIAAFGAAGTAHASAGTSAATSTAASGATNTAMGATSSTATSTATSAAATLACSHPSTVEVPEEYVARLERELEVICGMGFEGYFLIVADFINWARANAIPVGPGRGSGAGSLVAYALGITDLDPIEHDLLFERFLNPERVSMPDFDVDFCIEGRDRVIDYVAERYGRDRVSQIITYGTMAARAVVRDVGRVLGMPYGYVDRIAKLIPFELGITLERALAEDEELRGLYRSEDEVRTLIDLARRLEGLARNAGTHAGGVVIAPAPLTEFMPLYVETGEGASLTQLDKDDLEAIGLIKFDFLGLKTLTIIDKALTSINRERAERGQPPIDISAIPQDDVPSYELLRRCQTTAVFQLESRGMRDLIKRLQPDRFEDLVAILALFRPGPLQSGMVDEFIDRKHGRASAPIDYLHPDLEPVLKPTYGVILYQEQVMQIAQVLAGYSLGGADLLRRAMGKKKPEEMAKQRAVFREGAVARGMQGERADQIFDLIEKFAGYGFNKSHSAAYALIAYQTAWLKAHYLEAFMAAVMTADMDHTDKLEVLKEECAELGIRLEPPDVNRSDFAFTVGGARRVMYGLGALKGVGQGVVDAIVAEREANGPYTSLLDFCRRVGPQRLGRRAVEALVKAGALDALGANRATLMRAVPDTMALADRSAHAMAAGQATLFGAEEEDEELEHVFVQVREWSKRERLEAEYEALGLCLTGHFFDEYEGHCRHFTHGPIAKLAAAPPGDGLPAYQQPRREVTVAGVVLRMGRRGSAFTVDLHDGTKRMEVSLFDEVFALCKHLVTKHAVLVVEGQMRYDDFSSAWRINARRVRSVDEAIEEHARRITIRWNGRRTAPDFVRSLERTLAPFRRGECLVSVEYTGTTAGAVLTLGDAWRVRPTRELRDALTRLLGEESYTLHYRPPTH